MRALRQVAAKLQVCNLSLCTRSAGIDALQVMVLELWLVCVVPETMLPRLRLACELMLGVDCGLVALQDSSSEK